MDGSLEGSVVESRINPGNLVFDGKVRHGNISSTAMFGKDFGKGLLGRSFQGEFSVDQGRMDAARN